jgi:hypothetical protein
VSGLPLGCDCIASTSAGRVPHNLHSRGGVHTRTSQVGCGTVSQVMEPKPTISLSHVLVPSRPPVYNTGSIWPLSLLRLP